MSTQRPFLGNFLAAFRAHTPQINKPSTSISASAAVAASSAIWGAPSTSQQLTRNLSTSASTETITTSSPRPINTKSNPNPYSQQPPTSSTATAAPDRQLVASLSPLQHNVSPSTHLPRSPSSTGLPVYGPQNKPQPSYPTCQEVRKSRRGSDSSQESGGAFREVRGGSEKWFIGGLTPSGEEKYYKLSLIRRERSWDRISADRLSL